MATRTLVSSRAARKLEFEKTAFSRLDRSSAVALTGGLISQGLKFLVMVYVARHFSVSEFGLLSFAIAVNAYMFVISSFGLNVFGSRTVAKAGGVAPGLLAEIFLLEFSLALLASGVAVGILAFIPGLSRLELQIVGLFGLSNVVQAGLFDWAFQGLHLQGISAALNILWQGTWLALTVVGINLGLGMIAVPAALCGAALVAAAMGYCWISRSESRTASSDFSSRKGLLWRSWQTLRSAAPLGWGTLLMTTLLWTDVLWVRLLRGEQAVGIYAAGNRAPVAVAMLGTFYVQGAFPLLSCRAGQSLEAFALCLSRTYADLTLLFLPGAFWAMGYAKEILQMIFRRPDYSSASWVFRIFQITLLLLVVNHLLGTGVLVALQRDRAFRKVLAWMVGCFMLLGPLLTYCFGIEGAALAALAVQLLGFRWFRAETRRLLRLNYFPGLLLPGLAGISAVSICRLMGLSLLPAAAVLASFYLVLLVPRVRNKHRGLAAGNLCSLMPRPE
jgi:O-antigen/teichoic acid export membrane protein